MPARTNGAPRWEVHASGSIAKDLQRIQRRAARQGRGEHVLAAMRQIYRRLQRNPRAAGEPSYYLPGLRMRIRTITVRPLVVHFGVCDDRPLVFIKGVKLLSSPNQ
ncbi:MAG: hypothetical protein E6K70_24170 [Planctomycetota bacterium]|nr:MAG: hypothetical protein E6K70_24170 [Planctomycetota bacterium]